MLLKGAKKKKKKKSVFFSQDYRLTYLFNSNSKEFQVFKIAKFEFKETEHYGLWQPLKIHGKSFNNLNYT